MARGTQVGGRQDIGDEEVVEASFGEYVGQRHLESYYWLNWNV